MPCKSKSIHFVVIWFDLCEIPLSLMKYERLSYPTNFLKIGGSDIKNKFIEYRTKQVNEFARRNVFHTLFTTKMQNLYSLDTFRGSIAYDPSYSKSIKKDWEKSLIYESIQLLYATLSGRKDVIHANRDRKIY